MTILRLPWQDTLSISRHSNFLEDPAASSPAHFSSGGLGVGPDIYGLPVIGEIPDILPSVNVRNRFPADGGSTYPNTINGVPEKYTVGVDLQFELTASLLATFAQLFFTDMNQQAGPGYLKSFTSTTSTPTWYCALLKQANLGFGITLDGQIAEGFICTRLKISGAEGGPLLLSVHLEGRSFDKAITDTNTIETAYATDPVLRFQDMQYLNVGIAGASPFTSVDCSAFELEWSHTPTFHFWNGVAAKSVSIGRITTTFSLLSSWEGVNAVNTGPSFLNAGGNGIGNNGISLAAMNSDYRFDFVSPAWEIVNVKIIEAGGETSVMSSGVIRESTSNWFAVRDYVNRN